MNTKQSKLTFRPVTTDDIPRICEFPQTVEELYFLFPKANFPLTVEQLKQTINSRFDSSVVCCNTQPVAFANIYDVEVDHHCNIGNVIVDPTQRGLGIGKYLMDQIIDLAIRKYKIKEIRLVCFTNNVNALLFYTKYGFKPYEIKPRQNFDGKQVAVIYMKLDLTY